MIHHGPMLGEAFDTRPNGYNALRLALASSVIVWHALLLASPGGYTSPLWQPLSSFAVDGFFVISGFLIVRSWDRRPNPAAFIRARLGRLLPGLWVCLTVTALVIAPLTSDVNLADQGRYVLENAGVLVTDPHIGATSGVAASWNLSIWSLWWELLCYAAVLAAGVLGILRLRVVAAAVALCWAWLAVTALAGVSFSPTFWASAVPRLGLMFALGAMAHLLRDRIHADGRLAAMATAVLAASAFTPDYHLLGAPALGYLVLWGGLELGRVRRLRLNADVSYGVYIYGAPVMVGLLSAGVVHDWWALAAVGYALTLPLAALSWFLVERPCLRRARGRRPQTAIAPIVLGARVFSDHFTEFGTT
jgi:peptidoglycan/LPS O-acetylase OafA/YrhL